AHRAGRTGVDHDRGQARSNGYRSSSPAAAVVGGKSRRTHRLRLTGGARRPLIEGGPAEAPRTNRAGDPLSNAMRPHATSPLDTADALAERVAASIGPERSDALPAIPVRCAIDPASYEASVRCRPGGMPSAGRMMIERAPTAVLTGIAGALDIALPQSATDWLRLAEQEGVPIIAGWDLRGGGAQRCLKLYVNASDASRATRGRLYTQLAPGATSSEPPAVIGLNARADGAVELKFYLQSADAVAVAADVSANARALAAAARAEGADAGGLLSLDVEDRGLRARAFFIALREPPDGTDWRCVRTLPGYDPLALAALMPFSPAPARSIGLSLSDGAWTIYCKPRHSGRAPEALEPA